MTFLILLSNHTQELIQKMMEMVGITTLDIQREIITCIPEVVDDSEHAQVATELRYSWRASGA